jgi:hypothetical protein
MTSPGLGARGMALRIVTGHQHDAATECSGDPDVVIAVDRHAPRHIDYPAAGEAFRRGLGAVGANHVHNKFSHEKRTFDPVERND